MGEEDFRHVGEQEGAVDGGDFDGVPVGVVFFGGDGNAWRDRHVAAAAADAAAVTGGFGNGVSVDKAVEFCFERALDVGIVFGGVLRGDLHDEGVEDVVVFGDKGAGGENVEAVAAEDAAEAGEQARAVGHEDHDLKLSLLNRMRLRTMGVSKSCTRFRRATGFRGTDGGRSRRNRARSIVFSAVFQGRRLG